MSDEHVKVAASSTFAANTAAIVDQAFRDSSTTLVILPPSKTKSPDPESVPGAIVSSPHFLTIFRYAVWLTVGLTVAWAAMSFLVSETTANQQEVFQVIGHLVTLGWGAIIGLVSGKHLHKLAATDVRTIAVVR
jgi:hypothetical protein